MGSREFLQTLPPSSSLGLSSSIANRTTVAQDTRSERPPSPSSVESNFHSLQRNNSDYAFGIMTTTMLNVDNDRPCEPSLVDSSTFDATFASLMREAVRLYVLKENVLHNDRFEAACNTKEVGP